MKIYDLIYNEVYSNFQIIEQYGEYDGFWYYKGKLLGLTKEGFNQEKFDKMIKLLVFL